MPDDADLFTIAARPTAERPMAGLTILVVEDSRFACEAMRLLCLRSGARIRRADTLRSARRHLQVYRPDVLIVDLGLPDGPGTELIGEQARAHPRVDLVAAISGDPALREAALAAGAEVFFEKPLTSLDSFQHTVLANLPGGPRGDPPRLLRGERVAPDPAAFEDDLAYAADLLATPQDESSLAYLAQFLDSLARTADDAPLGQAAAGLGMSRRSGLPYGGELARLAGLVQDRLGARSPA